MSPIFYALIRMSEPMVFDTVKANFLGCFTNGRAYTHSESISSMSSLKDSDLLSDSLNGFLTSSLNVELVYTILKGICTSLKKCQEQDTTKRDLRFNLSSIEVCNFKLWEVSHQQQFVNSLHMPFETKID